MDELKQYTKKTTKDILILGIFGVIFMIAAFAFFTKHNFILFVIMLIGSLVLFVGAFTSSSNDKKFYATIENSPNKDEILLDFKNAKAYANDDIRMGEKYIFTKKYTELICYEDIKKLQYVEHHDIETSRIEPSIFMELTNGRKRTLCSLYGNNYLLQAKEIFDVVLAKKPNVKIEEF